MDNIDKFSGKVEDYVKYRPSYPKEYFDYLANEVGLSGSSVVTDVGAGTGIFSKQLSEMVGKVFAVEPNLNMRTACEQYCSAVENISIIAGSAENTGLPDKSTDYITAAQAFHWFNKEKAKLEFQRILKPGGKVILAWNCKGADTDLMQEYYDLLKEMCPAFNELKNGSDADNRHSDFFRNGYCEHKTFNNDMALTLESFIGGSLSASYTPAKGDANYDGFIDGLTKLFNKYNKNGWLMLPNKTYSYVGEI